MKTFKKVYIAIDLHSKTSMIGYMNEDGKYMGHQRVATSGVNLINQVAAIPAEQKHLTIEQSNMAFWAAEQLRDYVDELIVCDPRYNSLISSSENKNDNLDTLRLCRLLRMGELKPIWSPKQMGVRRVFYHQIKEYQRLIKTQAIHKRQLGDSLRHWGINLKLTDTDYSNPDPILTQIDSSLLREELAGKFSFIQAITAQSRQQFARARQTGSQFWEIAEFQKMSGIGPVGAHTFSGYIQTPHRFRRRSQLIQFCKLGVRTFTSDGSKVRNQRLSKAGHGCLKNLAHVAWKASLNGKNEVSGFYQESLQECGNPVHARLNTQRKILITLWSIWKNKYSYNPEKFFSGNGDSAR
ncbi:MAG: transposase [Balneolaceae bacterium]